MSSAGTVLPVDMFTDYGEHYIAVNEAGRLRSKLPMWQPWRPFEEAYQRPIDEHWGLV